MDKTALDNLIKWKLREAGSADDTLTVIQNVRTEVIYDVCRRHPWSFLKRVDTSNSLTASDYQVALASDFISMVGVALVDSENVVYPVHPVKETDWEATNPDTDTASTRPTEYFLFHNSSNEHYMELRCKCDASYTLKYRYRKILGEDDISLLPNGLVLFNGAMATLAKADEMEAYEGAYERGIAKMWDSDEPIPDEEHVFLQDPSTVAFNQYQATL